MADQGELRKCSSDLSRLMASWSTLGLHSIATKSNFRNMYTTVDTAKLRMDLFTPDKCEYKWKIIQMSATLRAGIPRV